MAQKLLLLTLDPRDNLDITDRIPMLKQGWKIEQVAISPSPGPGSRVTVAVVVSGSEHPRGDADLGGPIID